MKKIHAVGAAVLVSLLALQPAFAQDSSSAPSSSESSSAPSSEMSSQPSSEPSAEPSKDNFGGLVSALQAGKSTVDLSVITEASVVNFVTVSSLKASGNTNALDNAIKKNMAAIDELRVKVAANAALAAKLTAAGFTADAVLAVMVAADGSVTVYLDDR